MPKYKEMFTDSLCNRLETANLDPTPQNIYVIKECAEATKEITEVLCGKK